DLAAASGTHIVPARSGRVAFAGWKTNCGGYRLWANHGNGRYPAYYHMRKGYPPPGQSLTAHRTTTDLVGAAGCASGYHTPVGRGRDRRRERQPGPSARRDLRGL